MKTVLITGSNGNLGKAVTSLFLQKQYRVIATVRDDQAKKELPSHPDLQIEVSDLNNEASATLLVEKILKQGATIDAALLLVGGFAMGKVAETSLKDIQKQIALNFETAYVMARPIFQHMTTQNKGRIVFIGARPALQPSAGKNMIAYTLSKSLV